MKAPTPEQIKRERERRALTQAQAGFIVGRSWRQWANYESGKTPIPQLVWEKFKK